PFRPVALPAPWLESLITKADSIAENRLSFFDLKDRDLGHPIRWNYEHAADRPTPMSFAPQIDYRDFDATGDCKLVWEPNRHHQLVALGRAYRATADQRYAEAAAEQLRSWMDQCPYPFGMNWRSPLELGIRLINWVWTVALIRPSGAVTAEFELRLMQF